MNKIIPILVLAALLGGCGTTRKTTEESTVKVADKAATETKAKETKNTTATTTTVERADTVVKVPGAVAKVAAPISNLLEGVQVVSDGITITATADTTTGKVTITAKVEEQDVPVVIDRVTTKEEVVTEHREQEQQATAETVAERTHQHTEVERKRWPGWLWFMAPVLVLGLGFIALRVGRRILLP